jgi:hypothetical protein
VRTAEVDFVGDKVANQYRVYWTRNSLSPRGVPLVIKEVREGLTREEANSLMASLACSGQLSFVSKSARN